MPNQEQASTRLRALESLEQPVIYPVVVANVSNPPTQLECNAAFGYTAAQVRDCWAGIINDTANARRWLIIAIADNWYYIGLTVCP